MRTMKYRVFVVVTLMMSVFALYGQELKPAQDYGGKWGYVDAAGKVVVPYKYYGAEEFSEGMARVSLYAVRRGYNPDGKKDELFGFIDSTGHLAVPCIYEDAYAFAEGLALVRWRDDRNYTHFAYIDKIGKVAIHLGTEYSDACPFTEGLAGVKQNDRWGYIDKAGKLVIPCEYEGVYGNYSPYAFSNGLAPVRRYGEWGYVDKTGNYYDFVGDFSEGLAVVRSGKLGYIDTLGKQVIPCRFNGAAPFSEGLAAVKLNGKWGYIDREGKEVIPLVYAEAKKFSKGLAEVRKVDNKGKSFGGIIDRAGYFYNDREEYLRKNFTEFARNVVGRDINEWQKKGKYEKISDWQVRVSEANRQRRIDSLMDVAEKDFIAVNTKELKHSFSVGDYDAEGEVFMLRHPEFGELLVPVPIAEAGSFEKNLKSYRKEYEYGISDNRLALAKVVFSDKKGHRYVYCNDADVQFTKLDIDYKFDKIDIDESLLASTVQTAPSGGKLTIKAVSVSVGASDVDTDIPVCSFRNTKTFAVIFANENYQSVSGVEFALNDGKTFRDYCCKTLGLPEKNVHFVQNATLGNMLNEVEWLTKVAKAYKGEAKVILYYAGHGIPDEGSKDAYLLPVDGNGYNTDIAYKLSDLYTSLSACTAQSAVVFLDACFSGADRSGGMLASVRGITVKPKTEVPHGNLVVLSASQGDETAYPYREKGHGLFTYFLLKKLQETKGSATLGELSAYITEQVRIHSVVENSKSQTPTVLPSATLGDSWTTLRLNK